jgi:hypothetical protein
MMIMSPRMTPRRLKMKWLKVFAGVLVPTEVIIDVSDSLSYLHLKTCDAATPRDPSKKGISATPISPAR